MLLIACRKCIENVKKFLLTTKRTLSRVGSRTVLLRLRPGLSPTTKDTCLSTCEGLQLDPHEDTVGAKKRMR